MVMSDKTYIRTRMSNKNLIGSLKQHRDEQEHPERHTRYVTVQAFHGRSGVAEMKRELARRKKLGRISKNAGTHRVRRDPLGLGSYW